MRPNRQAPAADPLSWLDRHVTEQAAHYGLSAERKADLFDGAAEYAEMIEYHLVDEPERQG